MANINSNERSGRLQPGNRRAFSERPNPKDTHRLVQKAPRRPRGYITNRHRLVVGKLVENSGNATKPLPMGKILVAAGYSHTTSLTPTKVTESRGFLELLEEVMPDTDLQEIHRGLLRSKTLDSLAFPAIGGENPADDELSDDDIELMIQDIGGTVRRVVHGQSRRIFYFYAPNDKTRLDALKLAYDLKGYTGKKVDPDPPIGGATYNTFIQNNTIDPNKIDAKQLVDNSLDYLMENMKKAKRTSNAIEGQVVHAERNQ